MRAPYPTLLPGCPKSTPRSYLLPNHADCSRFFLMSLERNLTHPAVVEYLESQPPLAPQRGPAAPAGGCATERARVRARMHASHMRTVIGTLALRCEDRDFPYVVCGGVWG